MSGPLQRDSDIPLYLQVSEILTQRIVNGECPSGSSLPAEPELCAEFNVARGTIRQALSKLETEGFIRREQGRGTFVTWGEESARMPGMSGNQIGLIVPYVRDSFVSTILLGAERAASEHNLSITFKHVENNPGRQNEVLNGLVEQRLAGIILYPVSSVRVELVQRLLQSGYPLVLVDRYLRGIACDYVMSDHFGGGLRATQHLLSLGHRRIGFVSWRDSSVSLEHRGAGYRQALLEAGLPYDPGLTCEVEGYPSVDLGALCDFLNGERRVTAIFCANDQIALAVYKAARQMGLRVPEDLALVGFDNLDFTQHLDVPLTTIEQPAFDLGRYAVEALIRRIQHQVSGGPQQIILPTRLVIRQSCGATLNGGADTAASESF